MELHCFAARSPAERESKKKALRGFAEYFRDCRSVVDLGSGDGVFLEALTDLYPDKDVLGVEINDELADLSRTAKPGLRIVKSDAVDFMAREGDRHDGYALSDMIEHLDAESGLKIINSIPGGAIVFIKTPNTDSVLGHQYYLQMPSHKTPYSRFVLKGILARAGFRILAEGECDGTFTPASLPGKIRRGALRLLFADEYPRIFGGGNYYVIAKKE
jgi:predicted TPR repeat methyltransferase